MSTNTATPGPDRLAFFKGQYVPLQDAKVSVMTHALHYGTAVFEGIRGNWNQEKETVYIFRLREHYQRLLRGCRLLMLNIPYTADDLCKITTELVERNRHRQDIYIRPLAYKSAEMVANLRLQDLASDFTLITIPFGSYLASDRLRCCTSSWRRVDDPMIPARLKIAGIYVNSILAKTEATLGGYDEAILLNQDGHVSEGSGENIFMVTDGRLVTPVLEDNALPGITRETVMHLAKTELGMEVVERTVDRSELYLADEVLLTGTAAHLTPVVELDHRPIGDGQPGPVSSQLQKMYSDVVVGRNPKYLHWCTPVSTKLAPAKAGILRDQPRGR
ncbi:MAG: branched-chain amino acid transaminase [Dehalococcoidia bacterium]|nr:branched-chain amino acid transaminase [Dehalococcoidia bacterium]MSQ17673.1 branched-chain amino acid transaminase [Dehalococcoidia bacterium]